MNKTNYLLKKNFREANEISFTVGLSGAAACVYQTKLIRYLYHCTLTVNRPSDIAIKEFL